MPNISLYNVHVPILDKISEVVDISKCDFGVRMGDYVDGWDFEKITPICFTSSKYVCIAHCTERYYKVEQQKLFKHELRGECFFVNLEFYKSN